MIANYRYAIERELEMPARDATDYHCSDLILCRKGLQAGK